MDTERRTKLLVWEKTLTVTWWFIEITTKKWEPLLLAGLWWSNTMKAPPRPQPPRSQMRFGWKTMPKLKRAKRINLYQKSGSSLQICDHRSLLENIQFLCIPCTGLLYLQKYVQTYQLSFTNGKASRARLQCDIQRLPWVSQTLFSKQ